MTIHSLTVEQIHDDIWQFSECTDEYGNMVDAYLLIGSERALMVDLLLMNKAVYDKVREITDLPLDAFVTHGHYDHAGVNVEIFHNAGCKVYMDMRDWPVMQSMGVSPMEAAWFTPIQEGDQLDLGNYQLDIMSVPGHTPGSLVAIEKTQQWMFTGDSIGSGTIWMQLPHSLPLDQFKQSLLHLRTYTDSMDNLTIYSGHRRQSPTPLSHSYIQDLLEIIRQITDGEQKGTFEEVDLGDILLQYYVVSYGQMHGFCYDPEKITS